MDKYIIDTNIFFNMESDINLGKNTEEVVVNMTKIATQLKKNNKAELITSPRVIEEFLGFFDNKNQLFIKDFLSCIIVKSPDIHNIQISGSIVSEIINNIKERSYRGLTIGEEEMIRAVKNINESVKQNKKDFEIAIGEYIRHFRERYRNATRTGFIDSLADLDCILLAKELNGYLISTDEGVINWGRRFGVKEVPLSAWVLQMQKLL